jgi:quaternary ammonium compound-resistance protein SugE
MALLRRILSRGQRTARREHRLLGAGLFEIVWPLATKYSNGLHRPLPTVAALATIIGNIFLLSAAMRTLPVATVCGVLIGFGAIGTSIAGSLLFGEPFSLKEGFSVALIVSGVIGLKVRSLAL